jgi:hypothetical protein
VTQIAIRIDKSFSYRTVAERWSNKYHLSGTEPANPTEWGALVDALVAVEKAIFPSTTTIVYAAGYYGDTLPAVFTRDYTLTPFTPVAGTYTYTAGAGTVQAPGDAAAWVRWPTGQFNSKGRPIYLRKYYHDPIVVPPDALFGSYKTALGTLATALETGFISGAHKLCDKDGNIVTSHTVPTYVTTRTLKRRGKSPI